MTKLNSYLHLIRFFNPIGFWLLFWPGVWGLLISNNLNVENFTIVLLGSFLTRSLGCAINDFADKDFDKDVERTKTRPLASEQLTRTEAFIFIIAMGLSSIYLLLQTNAYTIKFVSVIAIPMIIIYPFMKRFIAVPQLFLGLTFGLSLPVSYSIAAGGLNLEIIFLYIGCVFWIMAYDSYYALCDVHDDKKLSLNSSAIFFGTDTQKATVLFSSLFAISYLIFTIKNASLILFVGFLFMVGHIYYQNKLSQLGRNLVAFKANNQIGLVIAGLLFIHYYGLFN